MIIWIDAQLSPHMASWIQDEFQKQLSCSIPEKIWSKSVINSDQGEWNVFVAPDESFLIFEVSGRATCT